MWTSRTRDPRSPFRSDDGPRCSEDGSFRKGCTARRCFGRVSAQAEADRSVQSRNRLGVCLADDERQATALARNPVATIRTTGSEGGEDPEAGRVPHLPAHLYNFADSEQRGSEGAQELLRHANSRITLDLYAQAGMPSKRLAQSKLVRMVLNKGEALA